MRVLHVGKYFPPDLGGMETYLADLIAAQHSLGVDAAALVHGRRLPRDPDWLFRVPTYGRLLYAPIAPGFRRAFKLAIKSLRPDVLHLHMPNTSAFWALTLKEARGIPWVVHWHADVVTSTIRVGLAVAYKAYRPMEQLLLARAKRIVVTSPPYLAASAALAPWHSKTLVVPLGLDAARFPESPPTERPLPWSEGVFRLLSIGRLTYYKGFETLIRAVVGMTGVELVVVGDGELREPLARLIAQHTPPGQHPRVKLIGAVSEDFKCALLSTSDAFCLASRERTEAFGIALMEAMAYSKPCLVSNLQGSGMPWLVREAGAGMVIEAEDPQVWQASISTLRAEPLRARALGAAGRRALLDRFTVEASAGALLDVYRACGIDPASRPRPSLPNLR